MEQEPDSWHTVETDRNEQCIFQFGFQTVDEKGVVYRRQNYYGILGASTDPAVCNLSRSATIPQANCDAPRSIHGFYASQPPRLLIPAFTGLYRSGGDYPDYAGRF